MIEALRKLGTAFGPTLKVPANGRDGPMVNLFEVAEDLGNRMIRIFTRDADGHRPLYAGRRKFQDDPHWRDLILFHEYFNGDTGEGPRAPRTRRDGPASSRRSSTSGAARRSPRRG